MDYNADSTATIPNVGTVVVNAVGSYTFTPVSKYNGKVPTITVTITDGTATLTATLDITVTAKNVSLPLTWLNFTATLKSDKTAGLKWQTASEQGVKDFVIERSADGTHWTALGTQWAKGATSLNTYEFIDQLPLEGINQYRIKQRSADATASYSAIRTVRLAGDWFTIAAIPNPAISQEKVEIKGKPNHTYQLFVLNEQGQTLMEARAIHGSHTLNLIQFTPGVYIIRAMDRVTGETREVKVVKE